MLCLQLLPGEYLTIGDNVVLQYDCTSGERCKLIVNAPREIPVVRGAVRERNGKPRPDCVFENLYSQPLDTVWAGLFPPGLRRFPLPGENAAVVALPACGKSPCLTKKSLAHPVSPGYEYRFLGCRYGRSLLFWGKFDRRNLQQFLKSNSCR